MDEGRGSLRVVIAWPYLAWGGAQTYLAGIGRHMPPNVVVDAVMPSGSDPVLLAYLAHRNIAVRFSGPPIDVGPATSITAKLRRRAHDARAHASWARTIASAKPDLVHVDLTPWTSCLVLFWLAARRPVVCTLHTALDHRAVRRSWRWRARLLARSSRITFLAASSSPAEFFGYWLGNGTPLTLIESGADEAELAAIVATSQPGLVVGAGQLIDRKGVDLLISALVVVRLEHPLAHGCWFGAGPERATLQRTIELAGATDYVRIEPPPAGRADFLQAMAGAEVYAQPSRDEGLPQSIIEAMAMGIPVVATDVGSVGSLVRNGETGVLIARNDVMALAAAISSLLADAQHAQRLAKQGAVAASSRFGAIAASARMLDQYNSIVGHGHSRRHAKGRAVWSRRGRGTADQ